MHNFEFSGLCLCQRSLAPVSVPVQRSAVVLQCCLRSFVAFMPLGCAVRGVPVNYLACAPLRLSIAGRCSATGRPFYEPLCQRAWCMMLVSVVMHDRTCSTALPDARCRDRLAS